MQNNGQFPKLLNYDGREYDILSIMGIFEKDNHSKEIKLCPKEDKTFKPKRNNISITKKFMTCDMTGHRVSANGYLLDSRGNVIDKKGDIIWRSHELLFNEPPKIF